MKPPLTGSAQLSVLYLGPDSGTSRHRRHAFTRLGHHVEQLDPRRLLPRSPWIDRIEWHLSPKPLAALVQRRIAAALHGGKFDIAFVDGGSLVTADAVRVLRRNCARVVNFNQDDPFGVRDRVRFSVYRKAVPEYDLVVVVRSPNIEEARQLGARHVLHHLCVSDEVAHAPRPLNPEIRAAWQSEVAFIGSWMPERGPFLAELVERGVPLSIFGPGWHKAPEWPRLQAHHRALYLDEDDYAYAVQCAGVLLGMLSKGNRDEHTTRTMEIPMLGGLLCAERTGVHESLYRDGAEAVFWSTAEECARVCHDLLADEPRRSRIAEAGQRRCMANNHTSESLIRRTMEALP